MRFKNRANGVVIVEWVLFTLPVVVLAIAGIILFQEFIIEFHIQNESTRTTAVTYFVTITFVILTALLLNILLTVGVKKGYTTSLKIWYVIQIVFIILLLSEFIRAVVIGILLALSGHFLPIILIIGLRGGFLGYKIVSVSMIINFTKGLTLSGDCAAADGIGIEEAVVTYHI